MKHIKIEAFNIPDAWFKTVSTIWNEGEIFTVGSGSECTETKKLDLTLHIKHPEIYPLVDDKAPTDMKHVQDYSLTYLYSNFKGDYSYTYGNRLREPVDQIQAIINAIVKCRSNRQLTMTIRVPEDVNNYEAPCLSIIDIEVLNNKVNMTTYFRSWDAYAGLPENIAGLYLLLEAIVNDVNEILISEGYPDEDLLETGEMIFHSKNAHIYKRQYVFVEELLKTKTSRLAEKLIDKELKN